MKPHTLGLLLILAAGGWLAGCTTPASAPAAAVPDQSEIVLQEGDTVRVTFPGAPNLDTPAQPIRRDGKITLPIVGEVLAAGRTPKELESDLATAYAGQLVSKEVVVTVENSTFSVYVDGPVQRPGKVTTDHPLTVLEAIMEAGGFDYSRANTKEVQIIRHVGRDKAYTYLTVNLDAVLKGTQRNLFYLAPGDIVHVRQKISVF